MSLVLLCGDENAGQTIRVAAPNRAVPLDVTPTPLGEAPALGSSVQVRATDFNFFPTTFTGSPFVRSNTGDFVVSLASPLWTFDNSGCVLTYAGAAGRRFLVTITTVLQTQSGSFINGKFWLGIDFNGDLLGTNATTNFLPSVTVTMNDPSTSQSRGYSTSRIINPAPANEVSPVVGLEFTADRTAQATRFSLTISEVGAG